jgi:hypothetical protein
VNIWNKREANKMTETVEIYFDDLTPDAQSNLLEKFQTTPRDENWDDVPLAIIERDVDDLYP